MYSFEDSVYGIWILLGDVLNIMKLLDDTLDLQGFRNLGISVSFPNNQCNYFFRNLAFFQFVVLSNETNIFMQQTRIFQFFNLRL